LNTHWLGGNELIGFEVRALVLQAIGLLPASEKRDDPDLEGHSVESQAETLIGTNATRCQAPERQDWSKDWKSKAKYRCCGVQIAALTLTLYPGPLMSMFSLRHPCAVQM